MVRCVLVCCFFFFKQKTAYEMRISDWSSDVCSSDLIRVRPGVVEYELPVRVVLEVAGCGGDEAVAVPQRQMACRPAPLFADAVVAFEAIEEGGGDERSAAVVERVPSGGGHIGQVFDDADVSQRNCPPIVKVSARSEEHTSEPQSLMRTEYAAFGL